MIIDCDIGFKDHVQALKNNHIDTVGRYYCSSADQHGAYKIISPKEAKQLANESIRLFTVHEPSSVDFSKGKEHATDAMQCATAIGQPDDTAIYFGIEKAGGFTHSDVEQKIKPYFTAIGNKIAGKYKIGVYSNGTPCAALLQAQLVKYTWLAAASYTHDGTWDFYSSGLWTVVQVGPLDIKTSLIPQWQYVPNLPDWKIDVDFAKDEFGAFIANPPTV